MDVGADFEDDLFRRLPEDVAVIRPVGHVEIAALVGSRGGVEPPVHAPLLPHGVCKPVVVGPHSESPAPLRPVGYIVRVAGPAIPGEKEKFMDGMKFLPWIKLLKFKVGIEHRVHPELDVLQLAEASAEPLRHRLGTDRGITADTAMVDPVADLTKSAICSGVLFLSLIFCCTGVVIVSSSC